MSRSEIRKYENSSVIVEIEMLIGEQRLPCRGLDELCILFSADPGVYEVDSIALIQRGSMDDALVRSHALTGWLPVAPEEISSIPKITSATRRFGLKNMSEANNNSWRMAA